MTALDLRDLTMQDVARSLGLSRVRHTDPRLPMAPDCPECAGETRWVDEIILGWQGTGWQFLACEECGAETDRRLVGL